MRLPDGSGIELIARDQPAATRNTPVAMITAFGNVEAAVEALKAGAFDFVTKPVDLPVLRGLVQHALDLREKRRTTGTTPIGHAACYGDSPAIAQLRADHRQGRAQPGAGLHRRRIRRRQGTRRAHRSTNRARAQPGPFVPVNCGAIPAELMESEFFGHKKGSFTGAHADKPGLFQAADGGTLFLDEVAELPLPMQVKLLRAIQEKSIRPVGANAEVNVDVRILSATHKNLAALVDDGRFRHDLYYRINVIELRVPPLRERLEDLPGLADRDPAAASPPPRAARCPRCRPRPSRPCARYPFPGNVRELENILERAMALADGERIEADDLRLPRRSGRAAIAAGRPAPAPLTRSPMRASARDAVRSRLDPRTLNPRDTASSACPSYIEQIERQAIEQALQENRYNKTTHRGGAGHHVPGAAVQAEEARDRLTPPDRTNRNGNGKPGEPFPVGICRTNRTGKHA